MDILKDVIQEKARKNQSIGWGDKKAVKQELAKPVETPIITNEELGKIAGVSKETIRKYEVIQKEGTDEIKKEVDSGEGEEESGGF